jgi:hypothetical protein
LLEEAEGRLEPRTLLSYVYTQLDALSRLPRRAAQVVDRLEDGTVKVGIVPTGLDDLERVVRSAANRVGAALIVVGLLVASALMAPRQPHGRVRRLRVLVRPRALHALEDRAHAR